MTSRERVLAVLLLGLILVGVGGVCGYMFIYSPLQDKKAAAKKLQSDVDDLDLKVLGMLKAAPQVAEVKRQSLPPDMNVARAQYKLMLERLLLQANIKDYKIPPERVSVGRPPITPEMAPKKPAYTTLTFTVDINKADIWQVVDFLYGYYQLNLLHQITDLRISRENKVTDPRNGLKVLITSEAIILDGAEPRATLFPVTTAVAAVAGGAGLQAVAARPELARRLTTTSGTPVLATRNRDYSLIALRDIFYGELPKYVEKPPAPISIGRFDDVEMKRDEKPREVRVWLSGDGSSSAKVVATVSGSLIPEGDLAYDPKTSKITIPAVDKDAPDSAVSTVSVAVTANGKTEKKSFKVSVEKLPVVERNVDDIAAFIRLPIVSTGSDGTAKAVVKDGANPFKYEIDATAKGITVTKWWPLTAKVWKKDLFYEHPPGVLAISDDGATATRRTFKVIAIEQDAIIVCEIGRPEPAKDTRPAMPGKGFRPPGSSPRQGPGDPLAAVGSNLAIAIPQPVYYRWSSGKSLKELVRLKPDEVEKILARVKAEGPVGPGVMTAAGN
jgi:hypothetical protein